MPAADDVRNAVARFHAARDATKAAAEQAKAQREADRAAGVASNPPSTTDTEVPP